MHQEHAIGPDTHAAPSGGLPETAALLRALAAASDWRSLCELLDRAIPVVLPSTRLDIYAIDADGLLALRFTSDAEHAPAPPADGDVRLRYQLQCQGYSAIMIVPLIAAGRPGGRLVLARRNDRLTPGAQVLAEQLAPLLALWLRFDQLNGELAAGAAREATLEQRVRATDSLRLHAVLVAGAAHDIGNLFTTMMGYAQILQQDLPAPFQDDIRMIVRAVEDGRQLLRRLQASDPAPDGSVAAATSVAQVVHEVVRLTRPLWERRSGVSVQTAIESTPLVRMPAQDLREVLVNLVMNAVAALSDGGTITLRCRADAGRASVSVADTGYGIARERHSLIFQPFVTTRADGSGLGLSVSRALVESHGGTLTVESEPGSGATFTISLPTAS